MRVILLLLLLSAGRAFSAHWTVACPGTFSGLADASAAVAIGTNMFVVASDEDNILRLFRSDQPGPPLREFDVNTFLDLRGRSQEADLEAAARIGNRAFWMGSHGRNKDGKGRPNRCRFFATDIKVTGGDVTLSPVGQPYRELLQDLIDDPRLDRFHLYEAGLLAPKAAGALNIEGLAPTPEGHLLIGFRNPIPQGKALIVPMLNPNEVIEGRRARFGEAILLDLDGLGIRDLAGQDGSYLIIAGDYEPGGKFRFYRWAGPGGKPKDIGLRHLGGYSPEALILYPDRGFRQVQVLSDDGMRMNNGIPEKEIPDPRRRTFRSFWITR